MKKKIIKKTLLTTAAFIVAIGILALAFLAYRYIKSEALQGPDAPLEITIEELANDETTKAEPKINNLEPSTPSVHETSDESPVPKSLNLEMPFYTQAPHSNWDYPWQEACEEASVLLTANLLLNMNLGLEDYNTELLRLVDWEMEYFGAYEHTDVHQTAEMLQINYGLDSVLHQNPTFEDIQEILASGNLIIAPFAGKLLGNPNFRNGGPVYHMLVIKGYDAEAMQIVTHDVGTRNGSNYVYDWSVIENSLHSWHDDDILLGEKTIIEVITP